MPKKWKLENDVYLISYEDMNADTIAYRDLGFKSVGAGSARIKKLKDAGCYDKIVAFMKAEQEMHDAWTMAFGPEWAKEIVESRLPND